LIKLDIINEVVNRTGITKTKAEMAVETVFETMKKALEQGDRIELRGFGVFNVKPRKTGIGRNPRTGAEFPYRRARRCVSSPVRSYRRCSRPLPRVSLCLPRISRPHRIRSTP
jgi:nucleoid DNA-binding protein